MHPAATRRARELVRTRAVRTTCSALGLAALGAASLAGGTVGIVLVVLVAIGAHVWAGLAGGAPAPSAPATRSTPSTPRREPVPVDKPAVPTARAPRLTRGERQAITIGALIWAVATYPMFRRLAHGRATGFLANDWLPHLSWAALVRWWPPRLPVPQFAFHLLTRAVLVVLPGVDLRTAAAIVGTAAAAGTGATVTWFMIRPLRSGGPRLHPTVALAASTWFLLSDLPQVLVFRSGALRFDHLNVSLHQWGTPTNVVVEAVQLLWFVAVAETFTGRAASLPRWTVAPLGVVTALALPALSLTLPLGLVLWLYRAGTLRSQWGDVVRLVWVPVGITLVAQAAIVTAWLPADRRGGVRLHLGGPLSSIDVLGPGLGFLVLPLLWLAAGRGSLRGSRELALVGWSLVVALVPLVLVAETGPRASEGNVGRVAYSIGWIGFLYLVRWVLDLGTHWRTFRTWPKREQVVAPLLVVTSVLCLAGGTLLYLEQIGLLRFTGVSA